MCSGRWSDPLERDEEGRLFIDFSPDLFMPLVDFLRQKSIEDPSEPVKPPELPQSREEAFRRVVRYYGLWDAMFGRGGDPKAVWEVAWGPVRVDDETGHMSLAGQIDGHSFCAAA